MKTENDRIHPQCKKVYQTTGWSLPKVDIMSVEEEKGVEVWVCTCVRGILNKKCSTKFDAILVWGKKTIRKLFLAHLGKYEYGFLHMTIVLWLDKESSYS